MAEEKFIALEETSQEIKASVAEVKTDTGNILKNIAEVLPEENYIERKFYSSKLIHGQDNAVLCTAQTNGDIMYIDFIKNVGTKTIDLEITSTVLNKPNQTTTFSLRPNEYLTNLTGNLTVRATLFKVKPEETPSIACQWCTVTRYKH